MNSTALVIYDGNCPMCRRAKQWLEQHARPRAFEFLPCQDPDRPIRAPQVSEAECMEAMQLVLPDGRVFAATEAFERILPLLRGPWRYLVWLFRLPGGRQLAPVVYRWIAANRMALSGLLDRKKPGDSCDIEKGCR